MSRIELDNELSKKFVIDKINELTATNNSFQAINNLDSFVYNSTGLELIIKYFKQEIEITKKDLISKLQQQMLYDKQELDRYKNQVKEYESDLEAIESLKAFKRKSKFLK